VLVRDCSSFGLPAYIRVAARGREERERLLAALRLEI
jgi:histidinol-phosphate/aromatic aminotransferase/cobyric acid decarboxylase-like protein